MFKSRSGHIKFFPNENVIQGLFVLGPFKLHKCKVRGSLGPTAHLSHIISLSLYIHLSVILYLVFLWLIFEFQKIVTANHLTP